MTAPTQQNPNSFLMGGGGAKSARFVTVGDTVGGLIIAEPEMRQQTEFVRGGGAGKPLFWDNGDAKMQLVVKVQTDLREDADDDGIRSLYMKGGFKRATTQKAVADAVRASGAQGLSVGGHLSMTLTAIDGSTADAPKSFTATYQPPQVGAGFLQAEQPAAPAAPQQPAYTPPPAPVPVPAAGHAASPAAGLVTMPDGSQVTPEVYALIQQTQPQPA